MRSLKIVGFAVLAGLGLVASKASAQISTAPFVLDYALCSNRGSVAVRLATAWQCLTPGIAGQAFVSGGPSADPYFATFSGGGNLVSSGTPTVAQLPLWVNASTLQGVSSLPMSLIPAQGLPLAKLQAFFVATDQLINIFATASKFVISSNAAGGNPFISAAVQDGSNGFSFPSGVTGIARNISQATGTGAYGAYTGGNTAFGIFGRADLGKGPYGTDTAITLSGTATNEFNAFNFSGKDANSAQTSNPGFGTLDSFTVPVVSACGGNWRCTSAFFAGPEGSIPSSFMNILYSQPSSFSGDGVTGTSGIWIDADATHSPRNSTLIRNSGTTGNTHLVLQTMGTAIPANPVLKHQDAGGTVNWYITQNGFANLPGGISAGSSLVQNASLPDLKYYATGNGADLKIWDEYVGTDGTFHARPLNDAQSAGTDWLAVTRGASAATLISFGAPVSIPGTGYAYGNGASAVTFSTTIPVANLSGVGSGISLSTAQNGTGAISGTTNPAFVSPTYTGSIAGPMQLDTSGTPALTSCGTGANIVGGNMGGQIQMGTSPPGGCTVTFSGGGFPNAAYCVMQAMSSTGGGTAFISTQSKTAFSFNTIVTTSGFYQYTCQGR